MTKIREAGNIMPIIECNKHSQEKIYASIVFRIKAMYGNKITDLEVEAATRNLINFCQEIVEYRCKQDTKEREV